MALLLTCADFEERAEVYGCAADRQQASIVFEVAADMVRMCPSLNRRVKILAATKRIGQSARKSIYLSWDDIAATSLDRYAALIERYQANRK
ncbi:hypothetical protein SDC9_161906 [bioreactor metagenome]|uniref:Uncharacterized protein n=1 Tax=bioreactor metagenome TaxID=1076179 RepID=A0A645FML3_9ZZZZ